MKRSILILAAVLTLTGCTTLETVSDVNAQSAEQAITDKPVTLKRSDGVTQTVYITEVRPDAITVRHGSGDYEVVAYSAIESMEYRRPDMVKNGLLAGVSLALLAAGASSAADGFAVLPGP